MVFVLCFVDQTLWLLLFHSLFSCGYYFEGTCGKPKDINNSWLRYVLKIPLGLELRSHGHELVDNLLLDS